MVRDNHFKDQDVIKPSEQSISEGKEVKIVRTFNAPKKLLYKAFIDPIYLQRWWGSYYCQESVCKVDPKVGGKIFITMTMKGGMEVRLEGEFYELIENEKIIFTTGTVGESNKDFEVVNLNTVVFKEKEGKTDLVLTVKMIKSPKIRAESAFQGMVRGWPESLNKLEELIKSGF